MDNCSNKTISVFFESQLKRFLFSLEYSPKTVQLYQSALTSFLHWLTVSAIEQPTREDAIQWKDYVKTSRSLGTAQTYLRVLKLFFRFLGRENIYPDITASIRGIRTETYPKRDWLTVRQVLSILDASSKMGKDLRNYAIILLMTTCGLRISEVARANVEDFRMIGGHLLLSVHGKGRDGKTDFVPVPEVTASAIRQYLNTRSDTATGAPLFLSQGNRCPGKRLSSRSISRIVKQVFLECGLKSSRLTAHSLRHTAITLSLQSGCSLQEAQQFARHRLITTTQIYAHNLENVRNPCADKVAKMLFPSTPFVKPSPENLSDNEKEERNWKKFFSGFAEHWDP